MRVQRRALAPLPRWLVILLVSLAGLLLEVGYTRIVSYKLWYYYTYLVIGLSLLGIGAGGVLVAISVRIRSWSTDRIVAVSAIWGAVVIAVGYLVIARIPIDTIAIWDYGSRGSVENLLLLGAICFTLFSAFVGLGVIIAVLLGRAGERVGRLYFADLVGAGLGCFLAIPLITLLSPPVVIVLAALVFALVGVLSMPRSRALLGVGVATSIVLVGAVSMDSLLPDVRPEETKLESEGNVHSEWGPVFRVDVDDYGPDAPNLLLIHDGTLGSALWEFDGDVDAQTRFDEDARSLPFATLGEPPERGLIIGSAGGNEIVASLYYGVDRIEAVELNPVTVSLLTDHFADYTGRLPERPGVHLHQGDGRTYLARSDADYDLIWYVAPDSYAANNAASSGAFVLSESYLYTWQMLRDSLEHLTDDGVMVAQFGELDIGRAANRTSRYLVTARKALAELGVEDPSRHLLVATQVTGGGDLSTIMVKRNPFTDAEIEAFATQAEELPLHVVEHAPGQATSESTVAALAGGSDADVTSIVDDYPKNITAVSDDAPFFWHFSPFPDVIGNIFEPLDVRDPEDVIGERVLLLLLGFSILFAALFLLLPFAVIRKQWGTFPAKGVSAVYFAALGLGFMLYEITMIQRLVRFLGYPTYSLTVTLAAILVTTGLGALASKRFAERPITPAIVLLGALAVLTLFYRLWLDDVTDALQSSGLGVRVVVAVAVLSPLGLCLGMFMPFGLRAVAALTATPAQVEQYVAWAWAVNGFFSVIGAVLTTILSMTFGFSTVQMGAFAVYVIAVAALAHLRGVRLTRRSATRPASDPAVEAAPAQSTA